MVQVQDLKNIKKTIPKQFIKIGNYNLVEHFLLKNLDNKIFDKIHNSCQKINHKKNIYTTLKKDFPKHQIIFVDAGHRKTRIIKKWSVVFTSKI